MHEATPPDPTPDASFYIHGSDPDEQARLGRLNGWINAMSRPRAAVQPGDRVLEIGAGLCHFALELAEDVGPDGCVVAIERDPRQLDGARATLAAADPAIAARVDLREGDAASPPLTVGEAASFDVAHARFILEHVTDPAAVVTAMHHAVRPGGRIILEDDDHELLRAWPAGSGLDDLWLAYRRAYDRLGVDPFVGRRLVSLLHAAGCERLTNDWLFFGGCGGDEHWPVVADNLRGLLDGARGTILAHGLMEPDAWTLCREQLDAWAARPDAALWYAISWACGVRT